MVAKPLTIVQILPELEEGGVETEVVELASFLAEQGHRSLVISGGGRLTASLIEHGVEHYCWSSIGSKTPCCLPYILRLRHFIQDQAVDILHLHSRLPAWVAYSAWKTIAQDKRPVLITSFHGFYSVNGYSEIMTKGQVIIAVSQAIEEHIRKQYGIKKEKISLIHGGYDNLRFNPALITTTRIQRLKKAWGIEDNTMPIILLPGRLTPLKGHRILIRALALLHPQPFLAIFPGDTKRNASYTKLLRNEIQAASLSNCLKLPGHCTDMPAAMAIADIVISATSDKAESFGKTSVEAMAMGCPVIATRHGGSLETVLDGVTGLLVTPHDVEGMRSAISQLLDSPETANRLGQQGKKRAQAHFTAHYRCQKTLQLYQHLKKRQRPPSKQDSDSLTVVQMLPELNNGGVERGTLEMGRYLSENGHASIVISAGGRLVSRLEDEGSHHIAWRVGTKSLLTLRYITRLRRLLCQRKVDILHLRSRMPAWIGYITWLSLPQEERPVLITTFHGFYSVNSYSAIMAKGETVITVSKSIDQHVHQQYSITSPTELIYRGIDETLFHPTLVSQARITQLTRVWQLPAGHNPPIIMLPGRLSRLKGQALFIQALQQISTLHFIAIIVGDIDEQSTFYQALQRECQQYQLEDKIKFVGYCDDMPAALLLADIVVSATSTTPEAFGRTSVEAMAMGKPVVATAQGGSLETIIDKKTGYLVPPEDPTEMANALRHLLENPTERRRLGQAGQQRAMNHFSLQRMCAKTLTLYKNLVKRKRGY